MLAFAAALGAAVMFLVAAIKTDADVPALWGWLGWMGLALFFAFSLPAAARRWGPPR